MKNKLNTFKIISSIFIIVAGVFMAILGGLGLAGQNVSGSIKAFQIVVGIILMLIGLLNALMTLLSDPTKFEVRNTLICGVLVGFGLFVMIGASEEIINTIIKLFIPFCLISIGAFVLVRAIVLLVKKLVAKKDGVIHTIISVIMIAIGIVFLIFSQEGVYIVYIAVGAILVIMEIVQIISYSRGDKDKNEKIAKAKETK